MSGVLTIVGSGEDGLVEVSAGGRYIFVNSAVLRSNGTNLIDAMITDGLLATDDELRVATNATGLDAEQSFEMRSAKRDALSRQKISNLYIVSKKARSVLIRRLEVMKVDYESLQVVSTRDVSNKMLRLCIKHLGFNTVFFQLIFWHLIGRLTQKSIPSKYRPSTGGIAILYAHFLAKGNALNVQLDGIGNSDTVAFYPDKMGEIIQHKFNNIHCFADQIIIKYSV